MLKRLEHAVELAADEVEAAERAVLERRQLVLEVQPALALGTHGLTLARGVIARLHSFCSSTARRCYQTVADRELPFAGSRESR